MKALYAAVLSALILTSGLSPACAEAPLAAGKPAGVKAANLQGNGWVLALGFGAAIATLAIILSAGDKNHPTTPTTTATGTGLP